MNRFPAALLCAATLAPAMRADDGGVPITRAEMKAAVERQKEAKPRLPLPPGAGPRGNNGAMQAHYLPAEWRGPQRPPNAGKPGERPRDAKGRTGGNSLLGDYGTELFWIVSRANDCRYCMGHQEVKLATAGYDDDRIAKLDGDWQTLTPGERAGLAYARKATLEPHRGLDAELEALTKHFPPPKVLAIVATVAGFNRTNRWTGSLNITQDREPFGRSESLAGGVSPTFAAQPTLVAPRAEIVRGPLPDRAEAHRRIAEAATRTPHPLFSAAPKHAGLPGWTRVVATTAEDAAAQVKQREALFAAGTLPTLLKAEIHWVCARHDRAWTALADAARRLKALGLDEDAMFALDDPARRAPADRAALALAERITVAPQRIAEADFAPLRGPFNDRGIAEIVWVSASANWFDRVTEPFRVPVD